MSDDLKRMIEKARQTEMTPEERERQRQSFAYGNAKFENERITRDSVKRASDKLKESGGGEAESSE